MDIKSKIDFGTDKKGTGFKIKTDKEYCYYLNSGRNAICEVLNNETIDKAYICSFNCDSVLMPFIKRGIEIRYFNVNQSFEIEETLFNELSSEKQKVLVYIQNYFCSYQLDEIKSKLKEYNVIVVEDITQCLLDDRYFCGADYYVGSVRKWFGVGEGGILCTNKKIQFKESDLEFINLYKESRNMLLNHVEKQKYLEKINYCEQLFDEKDTQLISNEVRNMIGTIDCDNVKQIRIENFCYLINELKNLDCITLPIKEMSNGSVPLYLPMLCRQRDKLQKFLFQYNIFLPIIWGKCKYLEGCLSPVVEKIYDEILCVPIDQRYDFKDLEIVKKAILEFYNKN